MNINRPDRAKACFQCKEYVVIFPDNPKNKEMLNYFEAKHLYHMVQVVNLSEIDKNKYRLCKR